jgi:hypothetical protein
MHAVRETEGMRCFGEEGLIDEGRCAPVRRPRSITAVEFQWQ